MTERRDLGLYAGDRLAHQAQHTEATGCGNRGHQPVSRHPSHAGQQYWQAAAQQLAKGRARGFGCDYHCQIWSACSYRLCTRSRLILSTAGCSELPMRPRSSRSSSTT